MPITPGGRFSPADSDEWDLTTDLAAMQVSNEAASATEISNAISGIPQNYRVGTNSQRLALAGSDLFQGLAFKTTDGGGFEWVNVNGTSAGWRVSPGQILTSLVGPTSNTTGAGTLVGSIISTIVLPVGQAFTIHGFYSGFSTVAGGIAEVVLNWRNSATDVSFTVRDGFQLGRSYSVGASSVAASNSYALRAVTTSAAKVSAGIYTATASSGVYGADGTNLWIESA